MPFKKITSLAMALALTGLAACGQDSLPPPAAEEAVPAGEVNIYSYRQETLIKPLLDALLKRRVLRSMLSRARQMPCWNA